MNIFRFCIYLTNIRTQEHIATPFNAKSDNYFTAWDEALEAAKNTLKSYTPDWYIENITSDPA